MNLYEYRQRVNNPGSVAWEVLELDLETSPYQVQEHLTDRERQDFIERFCALNVHTD